MRSASARAPSASVPACVSSASNSSVEGSVNAMFAMPAPRKATCFAISSCAMSVAGLARSTRSRRTAQGWPSVPVIRPASCRTFLTLAN